MGMTSFNPDVNIQDQHTPVVDFYFKKVLETTTLIENEAIDDKVIQVPSGSGFNVGDKICILENGRFYQSEVLGVAIATNKILTLDTPLDYAFTTSAIVQRCTTSLNIDGSSTTEIFYVSPPSGIEWDITRIIINITDGTAMDSGKFGGMTALTNGVVVRQKNGEYYNLFNLKTNADIALRAYDLEYDDKAPAGIYGLRSRRTFSGQNKNGVTVRLSGTDSEQIQVLIQDDLTGLTSFEIIAQGHVVDNS